MKKPICSGCFNKDREPDQRWVGRAFLLAPDEVCCRCGGLTRCGLTIEDGGENTTSRVSAL